jgi:hypothetical protein
LALAATAHGGGKLQVLGDMYAPKMKGHLSGGRTMDRDIVNDLAAVWQRYFPGEEFSVSDHKGLLAADLVDSFLASNLLSRVSTHAPSSPV